MKKYLVTWEIDAEELNPVIAAKSAWRNRNRKGSIANVFTVREKLPDGKLGKKQTVDLFERTLDGKYYSRKDENNLL